MATFYDTHAHLDYPDYEKDLPEVIARAQNAGIAKIISIGTSLASSERAIRLAERIPNVFAAVGWHPSEAMKAPADLRPALRELAKHPKVVAIGEIGLDYHHLPSAGGAHGPRHPMSGGVTRPASPPDTDADARYKQRQAELFAQQLEVAVEAGLNCVIHQRDAFDDALAQLKPFAGKVRGVFHCFGENADRMRRILKIGSLVSFTGIVTFKNGRQARETLAAAGWGQFMFETDCPFLAPAPFRGKRCEPAHVREISQLAAEVRKCSLEDLSAATMAAARDFFPKLAGK